MHGVLNKIYIDSRRKAASSISNGDFIIDLPFTYTFPENTFMTTGDIIIPNVMYSNEYNNNKLYMRIEAPPSTKTDFIISIVPQNYNIATLAEQLQLQLNIYANNLFVVQDSLTTNTITISITSGSETFRVFSNRELSSDSMGWTGPSYEKNNPQSFNAMIGNDDVDSKVCSYNNPFITGFVNTANIYSAYILCDQLSDSGNIGPRFEHNIIKKVPMDVPYGFLKSDNMINEHDLINVSRKTIRTLHFQIVDFHGNVVLFHGSHVSFTLFFRPMGIMSVGDGSGGSLSISNKSNSNASKLITLTS